MPLNTPSNTERIHALKPTEWGQQPATDYWLFPSSESPSVTAGDAHELADYGWTTTALTLTAGAAADFLSSTDFGDPGRIVLADASDVLQSPALFGEYSSVNLLYRGLGLGVPTTLNLECYAAFTTASGNETATCFGFVEDGGSIITANDAMATIFSNGTTFGLRSGAATDTGAAIDTAWHLWRIQVTAGSTIEWFIDGTSQGTIALQADEWPASFGAGVQAAGTNDISLGSVHIWYA